MSWLETADGRQHAAVRGACPQCEALWLVRDVALIDSGAGRLAKATRALMTHMGDVLHTDPPAARPGDPPPVVFLRPPLPNSVLTVSP